MPRILVIVSVVAAAAFWWTSRPLCSCTYQETAQMAAVRADLKNLQTAQEIYFADQDHYAAALDSLSDFAPSIGVTIALGTVTDSAWTAVGVHRDVSGWCAMYVGQIDPPVVGLSEGESGCRWTAAGHARQRALADER